MKTTLIKICAITFLFLAFGSLVFGQKKNKDDADAYIKELHDKKITYLVVNDVTSKTAQKYLKVLEENWKFTPKVELHSTEAMAAKKDDKSAIFIYTYDKFAWRPDVDVVTIGSGEDYYFMSTLRHPTEPTTYMEALKCQRDNKQTNYLEGKSLFEVEDNKLYCWGAGVFKSLIAQFVYSISEAEKKPDKKESKIEFNRAELQKLNKSVLFIPDYFF